MRYTANTQRLRHHTQRGTSLVEVLVVLVILVLGIFSIARLFPGGFFAVRSAENNTFADRLAQGQLESLKQNDAFLLDAVYIYSDTLGFLPGVGPDDLSGTTASPFMPPNGTADATLDDINKGRFIQNETFAVPSANTATGTATNGFSIHTLNYGPIVLPEPVVSYTAAGAPASVQGVPPVHSAPWTPITGNSQQAVPGDVSGSYNVSGGYDNPQDIITGAQTSYAMDYTGQRIAVPPVATYAQFFTLILKRQVVLSGGSATMTVTFYYPLVLPPSDTTGTDSKSAYDGGWFDPADPNTSTTYLDPNRPIVTDVQLPSGSTVANWLPGTASLVRTLTAETPGGSLSATLTALHNDADPYKYVLLNPDATLVNVNMGVFAFNPRLAGQKLSVSYVAYDWHIIHEDEDVPGNPNLLTQTQNGPPATPIRLTLNHLKRVGDVQSDQTAYSGLFRPSDTSNANGTNYDIVLLDTDTGDMQGLTAPPNPPPANSPIFDVDNAGTGAAATPDQVAISYQGGRITLPTDPGNAWYYGNHKHIRVFYEGDLGWAVAIQKAPSLYTPGTDGNLGVGQYAVSTGNPLHLHFPHCDSGKVVQIDDIVYKDPNGNLLQASGVSGTITSDDIGGDTDYIDISSFLPNAASPQPSGYPQIGSVTGISARAIVIWKERSNWKERSLDTVLTRTQ